MMEELQLPGELERGTPIAGYKIRQRVGAGPTGTVYAAVHPINGRKVAVKVDRSKVEVRTISGYYPNG